MPIKIKKQSNYGPKSKSKSKSQPYKNNKTKKGKSEAEQKYESAVYEKHFGSSHKEPKKKKPNVGKMFIMGGKKDNKKSNTK